MVVARKRALNSEKPLVNFRFIVMRHNEHEVPQLEDFTRSLGVDALTLKTLNPASQNPYAATAEVERRNDYLPQDVRFRRFHGDSTHDRIRRKDNPCEHLWYHPSIHWNGVVCTCTYDPNEKFPLGDLREQSFWEIWSGKPYRQLRRQFRENWNRVPRCGECSYAYEGGSCSHETIAKAVFFSKPKRVSA
jgi:radical SAM protein with 4Fe4S-binding SPASM domain